MSTIKTTITIDEEVWNQLKRTVSSKHRNLRKLSATVEEAIKTFNTSEVLNEFSTILNINANTYPSNKEVKERRPKLKTSAGETIREMRNEREAHICRLQ
ncbi:MAG: hypothetical protein ACPLKQ_03620 [Candidatus Bathyarchaeales archaeon]